jgi:hypothetical protein
MKAEEILSAIQARSVAIASYSPTDVASALTTPSSSPALRPKAVGRGLPSLLSSPQDDAHPSPRGQFMTPVQLPAPATSEPVVPEFALDGGHPGGIKRPRGESWCDSSLYFAQNACDPKVAAAYSSVVLPKASLATSPVIAPIPAPAFCLTEESLRRPRAGSSVAPLSTISPEAVTCKPQSSPVLSYSDYGASRADTAAAALLELLKLDPCEDLMMDYAHDDVFQVVPCDSDDDDDASAFYDDAGSDSSSLPSKRPRAMSWDRGSSGCDDEEGDAAVAAVRVRTHRVTLPSTAVAASVKSPASAGRPPRPSKGKAPKQRHDLRIRVAARGVVYIFGRAMTSRSLWWVGSDLVRFALLERHIIAPTFKFKVAPDVCDVDNGKPNGMNLSAYSRHPAVKAVVQLAVDTEAAMKRKLSPHARVRVKLCDTDPQVVAFKAYVEELADRLKL